MRIKSLIAAMFAALLLAAGQPEKAHAGLFISVTVAPPALPVYVQPPIPGPGFIWTPGYWSWDEDDGDYFWVPGTWVPAPQPGYLWTPGYWGWSNGVYAWNAGYWGPHVGFYGGVNYGFGYAGVGFGGGAWVGGVFSYNRFCTNVGGPGVVTNVYSKTVIVNNTTNVSFVGGNNGLHSTPNAQELAAANEHHMPPTTEQLKHHELARKNPDQKFSKNHGKPSNAATQKAGDFSKGHTYGAKSAGDHVKPASFTPKGAGTGHHADDKSHNAGDAHRDHRSNFIPPKGTSPKKPRPPSPPHPANKTPPKKDPKKHS